MKFNLLNIFLIIPFFVFSQGLNVYYYQSSFWSPVDKNFNEVYLSFEGKKLKYTKQENGMFAAKVGVTIKYTRNDTVYAFDKYSLVSPNIADTSFYIPDFIDVKRFKISPGEYDFSIEVYDENYSSHKLNYSEKIKVPEYKKTMFSDIELAEKIEAVNGNPEFMKSGFMIVPFVSSYYPTNIKQLKFYSELYILDNVLLSGEPVMIKYYLEPDDRSYKLGKFTKVYRRNAKNIMVVSGGFDISSLPSGNYNLVVECFNSNKELIASKKVFIQRSNSTVTTKFGNVYSIIVENTFIENVTDPDTLADYIKCLFPLMEPKQILFAKNQLKSRNIRWMQKFIYNYWYEINPANPAGEWQQYKKQVDLVDKHFSTRIKKGYETDRGRIYLRYGTPDDVIKRDNPSGSYPYEIWHYIQTRNQGNIKVVFVNRGMVDDYELIYTNLVGEVSDPNWLEKVKGNDRVINKRNFGNQIEDDFRNL